MAKATRTINRLHFEDLDPHRFEDLVRQVLHNFQDWHTLEATGRGGADDGIDIRGILLMPPADRETGNFGQRDWIIQCKRYQRMTPGQVREIIRDNLEAQTEIPFGYILVAACDFSKEAYDVFREEVAKYGIQQSLIWGKDELEDQLKLEKNRYLLYDFFGLTIGDLVEEEPGIPPAPGDPPFKGLRYFNVADAALFYGREALTAQLIRRLCQENFLSIVGASGSGKSSLVRAGIVATLQQNKPLVDGTATPEGSQNWPVYILEPGTHPLENLAVSLTQGAESVTATTTLMDDMLADARSLHLYARKLVTTHPGQPENLLLVVDQFEEVFTACKDENERQAFINNLITAVLKETAGPTILIMTLRADFYQHCAGFNNLRLMLEKHQAYIGPMTLDELRRAIEQPAAQDRWDFEPGLVDIMLRDIEDEPGSLPLLSHALLETWEKRQGRTLTLQGYQEAGGVRQAIAKTADRVYDDLTPEQQIIAREIFLRLTELGEGTQDTRRRAALDELVPDPDHRLEVEKVLETLANARLVTTERDSAEVSHEALIREWPVLRGWLEEGREGLRIHRHLTEAAIEWGRMGKDPGELYRGARLGQAWEWWQGNNPVLNELERSFLEASQEEETRIETEREAARQRELQQAEALAQQAQDLAETQSKRAEEQEQAATLMEIRNRVITGVSIVAILAAVVAIYFGFRAQGQSQLTRANELAAQALLNLEENLSLSLLLSVEAYRIKDTSQSLGSLLTTLEYNPRLAYAVPGHLGEVGSIVFSPDGKIMASSSCSDLSYFSDIDCQIILWDMETSKIIGQPITGAFGRIKELVFSPNSNVLASLEWDGRVIFWDIATQNIIREPMYGQALAFVSDDILAIATSDNQIELLDWKSGKKSGHPIEAGEAVHRLEYRPESHTLISFKTDRVQFWDMQTDKSKVNIPLPYGYYHCAVVSPDGSLLASVNVQDIIRLWDTSTGEYINGVQSFLLQDLSGIAFSGDGKTLITQGEDGSIEILDVQTLEKVEPPFYGHSNPITNFAVSPDGKYLASSDTSNELFIWHLDAQRPLSKPLVGHSYGVSAVAFSPDGETMASGSCGGESLDRLYYCSSGEIILWDLDSLSPIKEPLTGHSFRISTLAFSPDGRILASGSCGNTVDAWPCDQGEVILWDISTGKPIFPPFNTGGVKSLAFNPDGSLLVSGGMYGTLLWDVERGEELEQVFEGYSLDIHGDILAMGDFEYGPSPQITFVDLKDLEILGTPVDSHSTYSLTFDPSGKFLATGGFDEQIYLRDAESGQPIGRPLKHPGWISTLSFNQDGSRLASSADEKIILWDVNSHQPIGQPLQGGAAKFSPDGKYLAASGSGNIVQLWNMDVQNWLKRACQRAGRNLTMVEWETYFPGEKYRKTCPEHPSDPQILLSAQELAFSGELEGAIQEFQSAQAIDPSLEIDPDQIARRFRAYGLLEEGEYAAGRGEIIEALATFDEALSLYPELEIGAHSWNTLCWEGSLWGYAAEVMHACENAIDAAPFDAQIADSRGLAKALTGDYRTAIEDFTQYLQWCKSNIQYQTDCDRRETWITSLEAGQNPFSQEVLDDLR